MTGECWLSDEAWAAIDPLLPKVYAGARRVDDRCIISGIFHVLRSGCRWMDCPPIYGPHTTVYNRFNRWSRRGRWQAIFDALVQVVPKEHAFDRQHVDQGATISIRKKRGGTEQAIGRSRGGRTTKIHAITDSQGRLFRFSLTAGNVADITEAYRLARQLPSNGCLIGDMGWSYATNSPSAAQPASSPATRPASIHGRSTWKSIKTVISSSACSID